MSTPEYERARLERRKRLRFEATRDCYTVSQVGTVLGVGRTTAERMLQRGQLTETPYTCRPRRVPRASLLAWIERLDAEPRAHALTRLEALDRQRAAAGSIWVPIDRSRPDPAEEPGEAEQAAIAARVEAIRGGKEKRYRPVEIREVHFGAR